MTVIAHCQSCGDEHPVGDRQRDDSDHGTCTTTQCPSCGDTPYSSNAIEGSVKPCEERIADAVNDVYGVGNKTLANIQAHFDTYAGIEAASNAELKTIDGVGEKAATQIQERI